MGRFMEQHVYDMIVIGGGPGGCTAALYAARAGMDVVMLEKLAFGGQMAQSHQIDNYPGFPDGIDGLQLGTRMRQQAVKAGAKTVYAEVFHVELWEPPFRIRTGDGTLLAKTLIYAAGAEPRELGLPMERELVGKGVSYCAVCDGMFYRGKTVVVVGGGNAAVGEALLLSQIARNVILIHRRDALRAEKGAVDTLIHRQNVEVRLSSVVKNILHRETVCSVEIQNLSTGCEGEVPCDGVFISIGRRPSTDLVRDQLSLDNEGYIVSDETTKTNIPGVFAVGDVRGKPLRQIVTATADGAVAAHMAQQYLSRK